jgi:penicillin-binding protein 1B
LSRIAVGVFLLLCFGGGFYLAQLYGEISALIEQRRAALSSAIYSAPLRLEPGEDIARLRLADRLERLSYTRVDDPQKPGEYAENSAAVTLYIRPFRVGVHDHPSQIVRLLLDGNTIARVTDAYGAPLDGASLEPEVIGRLMPDAPAERVEVPLSELPPYLVKGLLATEDRWFYYHFGFDPIRIAEAAIIDLRTHRLEQGASTITQQLARTFIPRQGRSFRRKFRELAIALVLEMRLTKREILERYVNDVAMGDYHGSPIYGLPMAARYFFNKDIREVTPAEAATLIGMIRAPSLYDPRRHPDATRARRDTVLALMRRAGAIDQTTYAAAVAKPLVVAKDRPLRQAPYFTDYVTSLVMKIPGFDGHLEGVKVYTTLDPEFQAEAERSVEQNLARLEHDHPRLRRKQKDQRLESAMVALDAHTGAIRAMVGGRDYGASQYNRAVMAERQPGSAFKPIVYLTALDPERSPFVNPFTLATVLPDRPMSFGGWVPANYERTYHGQVTAAEALAESLNVPTAYVGSLMGPQAIVRTAHDLGIHEKLQAVLPIAIGADETTLLELTSAYQVFADEGLEDPPYAIEAVVDRQNHLIYTHGQQEQRVVRQDVAYVMTGALEGVLKYGTAAASPRMGINFPAAGKTGTTDDYHDAYFIGYTADVVCGVWVGFDEPKSIGLTGAAAALPAWAGFMTKAQMREPRDFEAPDGVTVVMVDPDSGGIATPSCPHAVAMPFLTGTQPTQLCPLHGGAYSSPATIAGAPGTMVTNAAPSPPPSGGVLGFFGRLFGAH